MFAKAYDEATLTLVTLMRGPIVAADVDRQVDAIYELTEATSKRTHDTPSLMLIVDTDEMPSSWDRRKMTSAGRRLPRVNFAFVSNFVGARNAAIAMVWVFPSRPGVERSTHWDTTSAIAWFEENERGSRAVLEKLVHDVNAIAATF